MKAILCAIVLMASFSIASDRTRYGSMEDIVYGSDSRDMYGSMDGRRGSDSGDMYGSMDDRRGSDSGDMYGSMDDRRGSDSGDMYGSMDDTGSDSGSDSDICETQEPQGPLAAAINASGNGCLEIMMFLLQANLPCSSDASVLHPTGIPRGVTTIEDTCPCSCRSHPITTEAPATTEPTTDESCVEHDVVDLTNMRSPQQFDTRDSVNAIQLSCGGRGKEVVFKITLQVGEFLTIGQSNNDYDSRHELRVGGQCPGRQVIGCVDDPDTQPLFYTNEEGEAVDAYFIIDAYSDDSGTGTVEWTVTVDEPVETVPPTMSPTMGTEMPFPDSCDSYVCDMHYNDLVETVLGEVRTLNADIAVANDRLDRTIEANDDLRSEMSNMMDTLTQQESDLNDLSETQHRHSDAMQCMSDAVSGDDEGSMRYGSMDHDNDSYGSMDYGSMTYGSMRGSRRGLTEKLEQLRRKLISLKRN